MSAAKQPIRAYGDRRDDGVMQLSFTLPVPLSEKAKEAAQQYCAALGLQDVKVASAESAAHQYTFFVVYAKSPVVLDYAAIEVPEVVFRKLGFDDLNQLIESEVGRRVVVFGACTGTDTHTVGIDAILNMKGYAGDYGLERYPGFEAFNLGSQVAVEEFVRFAKDHAIDALLASQVVTQKGSDITNFTALAELLEAEGLRDQIVLLCGGPRVTNLLATELGYDAGFGRGTLPSDVAAFIAQRVAERPVA